MSSPVHRGAMHEVRREMWLPSVGSSAAWFESYRARHPSHGLTAGARGFGRPPHTPDRSTRRLRGSEHSQRPLLSPGLILQRPQGYLHLRWQLVGRTHLRWERWCHGLAADVLMGLLKSSEKRVRRPSRAVPSGCERSRTRRLCALERGLAARHPRRRQMCMLLSRRVQLFHRGAHGNTVTAHRNETLNKGAV